MAALKHSTACLALIILSHFATAQVQPLANTTVSDCISLLNSVDEGGISKQRSFDPSASASLNSGSRNELRILNFSDEQGFVLLGRNGALFAFSPEGNIDVAKPDHPAFQLISVYSQLHDSLLPVPLCEALSQYTKGQGRGSVRPLIETSWDQFCNYNTLCPQDPNGTCGHTCAGDLPVALAQVLRYYRYPEHGIGMNSYGLMNYGSISANFGISTYAYDSMPAYTNGGNAEVNELIFHCGVGLETYYAPDYSYANIQDIPYVLRQ